MTTAGNPQCGHSAYMALTLRSPLAIPLFQPQRAQPTNTRAVAASIPITPSTPVARSLWHHSQPYGLFQQQRRILKTETHDIRRQRRAHKLLIIQEGVCRRLIVHQRQIIRHVV